MRISSLKLLSAIACTCLMGLGAAAQATPVNLLTNGSFETGNFSGWTGISNAGINSLSQYSIPAEDGFYYAGTSQAFASLSQTITDIAGDTLSLSGWGFIRGSYGGYYSIEFNGQTVATHSDYSGNPYYHYASLSSSVTATGHDKLTVSFGCGSSYCNGYGIVAVDNFSVTDATPPPATGGTGGSTAAVPEPKTFALLALALIGAGTLRRKRPSLS